MDQQRSEEDYKKMTGAEIRALCRNESFDRPTAGVATGYTQVNLVILPTALADDFESFCRKNPQPCPLLEKLDRGSYQPKRLAPDADIRTDLPRYCVYRKGECVDEPTSIRSYWPDVNEVSGADLVAFLIGCSFTFEAALLQASIPVRHIEEGCNVPMYRTNIACNPCGPFSCPMVVSMRPMNPQQAQQATKITASLGHAHGAPIHIGDPSQIGIQNLSQPDYGDAVTIQDGEEPVFWACGVTPTQAIIHAKPELAITHKPGYMLITNLSDQTLKDQPIASS